LGRSLVVRGLRIAAALFCAVAALLSCAPSAPRSDSRAARIASLAPAFTETLIALGAQDAIVAIGRYDPAVPGRPELPRVADAMTVDLEALTALAPDVVLVNSRLLAEKLAPAAGRVRVVELPTDRLADALAAVREIAKLTGRDREGDALGKSIDDALAGAKRRAAQRPGEPPRVLVVVQRRPFYVAGGGSFVHELLVAVGARNAFGDVTEPWPTVGEESIVARAPDVVLDASVGDVDTDAGRAEIAEDWKRLPTIPAVAKGRVHVIREDAIFRAGPRIPEALAVLERLLYAQDGK
jgi:ABC-type Fe3+-hydroxamate transport system substrate-binding protein